MSDTTTDQAGAGNGTPGAAHATPLASLRDAVLDAAAAVAPGVGSGGGSSEVDVRGADVRTAARSVTIERPRRAEFGDYSTNAAMVLAPAFGEPPRAIAERLAGALSERLGDS